MEAMDLRAENERLKVENSQLREKVEGLEAKVKQLMELLGQNSGNSNWPSSRDKTRKRKQTGQRKKSGKKAGGQKGHQGHTAKFNREPEIIKEHLPLTCQGCNQQFDENAQRGKVAKRQVLDLPPLRYITTEHQAVTLCCEKCGEETCGEFPAGVTNHIQYGERVKQLGVYLRVEQFVPYQRSQQMLEDLFELPVCVGSLQNFMVAAAENVTGVTDAIGEAVSAAGVVNADETGHYIGGERHWLHTASTPELTYLMSHQRRGRKAIDAIGIVPQVRGTLVHDALPTYFLYEDATHALCNAHHLRDLTGIIENDDQRWAKQMHAFLLAAKRLVDEAKQTGNPHLPPAVIARIDRLYAALVSNGLAENPLPNAPPKPQRGRPKKTKARNLVERFLRRQDAILRFVYDFEVPFDNNLAERDIRMMKVQQKISGCFRSPLGALQFCKLRSYTSTIRKQGLSVWNALGSLFSGDILLPQLSPV